MKFISIGGWCGSTISLRGNLLYQEALPFDHVRCTFMGVVDCFETNFSNFFPRKIEIDVIENYKYSGKSIRSKHFSFYHHNLYNPEVIHDFIRRIDRLTKLLENTDENVVFVRTITTHDYNDELQISQRFLDIVKSKYPKLNFILIFIIPGQESTQYYKNINEKIFIFSLDDRSENNDKLTEEYKPIYDYILDNDLFKKIPEESQLNIKNGYNRFVEINGIPVIRNDI
jgi:hypothetical protein